MMNTMGFDFNRAMNDDACLEGRGRRTVECKKCHKIGSLMIKPTKSKGKTYKCYYYVVHRDGKKKIWHYMGKFEKLPKEYKKILEINP